ncbi:MAG TPA: orotate phosphoribosyltransferase [Arenicellales bacterium]|nr:orotate phosphoribosyltransferase [Arenicellales bacterium]
MTNREQQFLQFAMSSGVLRFGEFTLKSGRVSPYFFNAGLFCTGAMLSQLAGFYAAVLCENEPDDFMLFGPAYKGIVLATATAAALHDQYGRNVPFAYNRKEVKDHGEGGTVVGAELAGRVVIIDDVITAGTAIGESMDIIESAGAQAAAVIVALDREEIVSDQGQSAITQIRERYGLPVHVIARFSALIETLRATPDLKQHLDALEAYRNRYGDPPADANS